MNDGDKERYNYNLKSTKTNFIVSCIIAIFCMIIIAIGNISKTALFFTILGIIIIYGIICLTVINHLNRNKAYKEALNLIRQHNQNNLGKSSNSADVIELMIINMEEIREYYKLSKIMANLSFILSFFMCIFGFFIIAGSIIAFFFKDISFMEPIIPIIGGAIVEVIAGTSLVVYKKSLEQLNHYYESLHNNERFLSLVTIVEKLSDDEKDEAYKNIINSQLELLKKSL